MRFTCDSQTLIDSLQIVTKALPARTPNQLLEGILIETDMNEVILTCSDERITITTRFDAQVSEPGRGVVRGKLFSEVIRRLEAGEVSVTMNNRFEFRIQGGGSRTNLAGFDADLYPQLPRIEGEKEISLPQDMLKDMIQKTQFAIAAEDIREVLTGCLLEIAGGDVTMVALDGYRMALKRAKCADVLDSFNAIIPGRAVGDIGKLLSDDPDAFASLSYGGGKLHIRLDRTDIYVILVEGDYVNYRAILPLGFSTRVVLDLATLGQSVDRAALIAREGNNNLIILKVHDGVLDLEAHAQSGDAFERLEVQQDGPDLNIAFNVKYLIDVVRNVDAEQIELSMNNAISPCVASPVDDRDYIHLILPVRTNLVN